MSYPVYLIALAALFAILVYLYLKYNYHKCPKGKVIIVLGYLGKKRQYKAVFSGSVFLIPLIQYIEYFDLSVYQKALKVKSKSDDGRLFTVDLKVNYSITNNPHDIKNAIDMLSGLPSDKIQHLGGNIIELSIQELALKKQIIKYDHKKLENDLSRKITNEFDHYGFRVIDMNISFY